MSFFWKSWRGNKSIKSVNCLPASIKSMHPVKKYPQIIDLFFCTRKMLAIMFLFPTNSLISSGTCSTPKLSKLTISFLLQSKAIQMCAYMYIFIKVYYVCPILYFFRQIVSRINTIKSWLILIILLYFKVC